jgi:hypothetical protein
MSPAQALMPASGADGRPAAVQALLADLCRAPVAVERWERLEPWAVARVLLGGAGPGRTVIVKWVRAGPAQARTEPWRLRTELAALQFELSAATAGQAGTYQARCAAPGIPGPAG